MLVRIWQGKAVLAAVILPFLIYLGLALVLEDQPEYPWLLLAMANLAACHVSSMGIMLAPVVTGLFVLLALVKNRSSEISLWDFVLYAIPASGRCIFMSVSRVNPGNTKELLHATADKGEQTLWIM